MAPGANAPQTNLHAILMGSIVYLAAAVPLIWTGIGSIRSKRWVRPIIIIAAVFCIISGTMAVAVMLMQAVSGDLALTIPKAAPGAPVAAPSPAGIFAAMIVGMIFVTLAMIAVPAAMLHFYAKSSTKEKLILLDPAPNWTDRLPIPALGWAIGCLLAGLSMLAATFGQFAIFFDRLLTGPPAILQLSLTSLLLLLGAYLCYTRPRQGWRLTFSVIIFLALSSFVYTIRADPAQLQQLMATKLASYGVPQTNSPTYSNTFTLRAGGTLYYCAALAYGLYVRRHFANTQNVPFLRAGL